MGIPKGVFASPLKVGVVDGVYLQSDYFSELGSGNTRAKWIIVIRRVAYQTRHRPLIEYLAEYCREMILNPSSNENFVR